MSNEKQKKPPRARNRNSVTLQDVARAAGTSIATVSFVANGRMDARIPEKTRTRINEIIEEMGYRPNALAQNLANGSSKFIGLVTDAIATTPFAGQIIRGAQDEAWKNGYILLVANTEGNIPAEKEAISMMLEHQVRGILYSTWYHRETVVPIELEESEFVLVNCFSPSSNSHSVIPDEEQGGFAATEVLIKNGHKRIAFINATTPAPAREGRSKGYRLALEKAGIQFDPSLVLEAFPDQEGGYGILESLVKLDVTAVFCYNDRMAMGLYEAIKGIGKTIPQDFAIVGFDNQEVIAAHLRPPLTTVALPHYEIGVAGIKALLGINPTAAEKSLKITCPVIDRESVTNIKKTVNSLIHFNE